LVSLVLPFLALRYPSISLQLQNPAPCLLAPDRGRAICQCLVCYPCLGLSISLAAYLGPSISLILPLNLGPRVNLSLSLGLGLYREVSVGFALTSSSDSRPL